MSAWTYFKEWATPKKWAEKWADVSPQPTHLSACERNAESRQRKQHARGHNFAWGNSNSIDTHALSDCACVGLAAYSILAI